MAAGDATVSLIYPKEFFEKNKPTIDEDLCFVIMPFDASFGDVYKTIEQTLAELGHRALRADQVFDTKPIMISIMEKINQAHLVIADVTDRNANVFYELGMAHVLKDRVVLITQRVDDVPFDLRHFRHIVYEPTPEGAAKLRQSLLETVRAVGFANEPMAAGEVSTHEEPPAEERQLASLLSTSILYHVSYKDSKGRMFATLTRWVEFDEVTEKTQSLAFRGGSFGGDEWCRLSLQPGTLPLDEVLKEFGLEYTAINFKLKEPFDIGGLVRRSRSGTRKITSLEKSGALLEIPIGGTRLAIVNTGEGASLTIEATLNKFKPRAPSVPPDALLDFLLEDPPTQKLQDSVRVSLGILRSA